MRASIDCWLTRQQLLRAKHFVYRVFDRDGELLYVGCTQHPAGRLADHRRQAPWWSLAATCSWHQYPCFDTARSAERSAIETERASRVAQFTAVPI